MRRRSVLALANLILLSLGACDRKPKVAPPVAGKALEQKLTTLVAGFDGTVGVAVIDVKRGWTAQVAGYKTFPQQSVAKLWVAVAFLDAVDRGRFKLDDTVLVTKADTGVFHQPILAEVGKVGKRFTYAELLERAITQSDNAADDILIRTLGGADAVQATLDAKHVAAKIGASQPELQSRIAGIEWKPEYAGGYKFQAAREQLPMTVRRAALDAYLADPLDGASPLGTVQALNALHHGQLLRPETTALLLDMLSRTKTGPMRLRGGLPADWTIAHKTGTGQVMGLLATATNDVGFLTAPDGHTYAVAVFIASTNKPVPERLAFLQSIAAAVVDDWRTDAAREAQT
jgi:beta-lactamase class A